MLLNLEEHHKEHLLVLTKQPEGVLNTCCQLALKHLKQGASIKDYVSYARENDLDPHFIKNTIASLVNLIIESCKMKLQEADFQEVLRSLGFSEAQQSAVGTLYKDSKDEISKKLSETGITFTEYQDLNWRFEVQVGSRAAMHQTIPLVTFDLALKNADKPRNDEHKALQTDPNNLHYLTQELEMALQEGRSQHIRNVLKTIR